jgi:hypothetical protein
MQQVFHSTTVFLFFNHGIFSTTENIEDTVKKKISVNPAFSVVCLLNSSTAVNTEDTEKKTISVNPVPSVVDVVL